MSMTRRDFTELAKSLKALRTDLHNASADGCDNSISLAYQAHERRIMQICKRHNPEFDTGRFLNAIGGA